MQKPTLAHRAQYALTRGLEGVVTTLPDAAAERLAAGVGALVHGPLGIRREVVYANLRRAFPEASEEWIGATARAAYRHLGREAAATMRLSRMSRDDVVARTEMVGWDAFRAAAAEGRGVVLGTGHLGNWEIGGAAIAARGLPTSAIVRRQSNALVDRRLDGTRRRLGVDTIDVADAQREATQALRAGRVVGILADQDARRSGVWVPFFGIPSSTPRGPAFFALRVGAPLFAAAVFRLPGAFRYRVVLEPVAVARTGDLAADIVRVTAALTARLEASVRVAPEQYFWFHRRWKTRPPAEHLPLSPGTNPERQVSVQPEDGPV